MEIFVTEKSNIWEYLKVTTRQIRVHNIFYGIRTHNQDITSKKIMGWYLQYDAMSMCKVSVTSSHLERHRVFFRRRHWHPTPVFLPGKSHGRRSLAGCSPWGREESDTTERLHCHFSLSCIGGGNGNPLQCSCLENPRDGGAWWAAIYGVTQSQT